MLTEPSETRQHPEGSLQRKAQVARRIGDERLYEAAQTDTDGPSELDGGLKERADEGLLMTETTISYGVRMQRGGEDTLRRGWR